MLKKLLSFLIVLLPSFLKVLVLRHVFGYSIGPGVRIGLSIVVAGQCSLGKNTRIGHFNYIVGMHELQVGKDCVIGHFNIVLGGSRVSLGEGAMIGRFNVINSILNPLVRGRPDPVLEMGRRAIVTASHKIDFTDRVTLEDSVVLAGRLSNLWTHNRQDVGPVRIGAHCYVGSGIQMVPGSAIGPYCVVGLGAVITRQFTDDHVLIAGVPAKVIKPLDADSTRLVTFPTRPDLDGIPADAGLNSTGTAS
jgi:acetyltransferase-like isoleucine patch superfamily enzyme